MNNFFKIILVIICILLVSGFAYGMIDMTTEEALNKGIITIDVLDRYGIEYIKKEK